MGGRPLLSLLAVLVSWASQVCQGNADTKRLYHDLINGYSSLIRPVGNNSDRLTVKMGLRLSQLIDVVSEPCFTRPTPRRIDRRGEECGAAEAAELSRAIDI